MFKMQIISSCVILSMLTVNILCNGQKDKVWNIAFVPSEVVAVPGLCALISCTFIYPNEEHPFTSIQFRECNATGCKQIIFNNKNKTNDDERIKILDPDKRKNNCSFIIKDIKPEDQGEYVSRVEASGLNQTFFFKISIQDEPIMDVPPLCEGQKVNLTCSAPFPCPETPPDITWWMKKTGENTTDLKDDNITLITSINFYNSTLTLTPTSDLHNATVGCNVSYGSKNISTSRTLEVMYEPIMDVPPLCEGQEVNLTCSAHFPCPETPYITWWIKKTGENTTDLKDDNITLITSISPCNSTLTLTPASDLHNAIVGCNVSYGSISISTSRTLKVTYEPIMDVPPLCEGQKVNLRCSAHFPCPETPPNITWWMKKTGENTTDLKDDNITLITSINFYNSTLTLPRNADLHNAIVGCNVSYGSKNISTSRTLEVMCNKNADKLNTSNNTTGDMTDPKRNTDNALDDFFKKWDISKVLTFVAGMACSALIFSMVLCCWVSCHRGKKHKVPTANLDTEVILEMVQTDVAQTGTNEETPLREQFNGGIPNTAGPTDGGEEEEEGAVGMNPKEVDYASIDYSLLKDREPEEGEKDPTETDYAEIKRDKKEDGKETEVLQDEDDQTETQDQIEGEEEL